MQAMKETAEINRIDAFLNGYLFCEFRMSGVPTDSRVRRNLAEITAYMVLGDKHSEVDGLVRRIDYITAVARIRSPGSILGQLHEEITQFVEKHRVDVTHDGETLEKLKPNDVLRSELMKMGLYGILH